MTIFNHPQVIIRHAGRPSEDTAKSVIKSCGQGRIGMLGAPLTPKDDDRLLKTFREANHMAFFFPRRGSQPVTAYHVDFQGWREVEITRTNVVPTPVLWEERDKWAIAFVGKEDLDYSRTEEATWFLDKAACTIGQLNAEFAIGDLNKNLLLHLDVDPSRFAWPMMVFGPERVKKMGKEKLLDAPAWKAEELPYGGVWVQASQNPFKESKKEVRSLAAHLGFEAPY